MNPTRPVYDAIRRGSLAVTAAQVVSQVVSLAVLAILYRWVGPEPYGLVGMVLPWLLLPRVLIASGLDAATIQQPDVTEGQVSALFWINLGLGLAMAAVTAAGAPVMVWFYGEPRLLPLTLAMSGTMVAVALGTQHQALLQRNLRIDTLMYVRVGAQAVAGVAGVAAALAGWGVWALVVQQYAEPLAQAVLAWAVEPWRPSFVFRGAGARGLVHFGGYFTLANLMFYAMANVDKVLVGYWLGPAALALYGQAFTLMMRPVNTLVGPVTAVMLPALSRAKTDRRQYADLLAGFSRFLGLVLFPCGVGLAIVAPEAIAVIGGPEWTAAGPILAVLALTIVVQGHFGALGSVFASVGRADRLAFASLAIAAAVAAAFVTSLRLGMTTSGPLVWGASGYTLAMLVLVMPAYLWFACRTVEVRLRDLLVPLGPSFIAAATMGVAVAVCRWALVTYAALPPAALLAIEVAIGAAVYAGMAWGEIRWVLAHGFGRE